MLKLWELAKLHGMHYNTLHNRVVHYGWKIDRALSQPVRPRKKAGAPPLTKDCEWCGSTFEKIGKCSFRDWNARIYCSERCNIEHKKDGGRLFRRKRAV